MCWWIFHDWQLKKAWGRAFILKGYECKKCGKRSWRGYDCHLSSAVEWLNEETTNDLAR